MLALNGNAPCAQDVLAVEDAAQLDDMIMNLLSQKKLSKLVQTLNAEMRSDNLDVRALADAALTRLGFVDPA